jgi:uncharacterized membrane protein YgcG
MKQLIGTTLGQYEIKSQIGQGGMAYVFKAYQPGLDRHVALKVLPPVLAAEPGFVERFQREALAIARLHHPNILPVYDFGVQEDYTYIVMRYVENSTTLTDLMQDGAPMDQLVEYIVQVASALNYAHKQGIIHRDVKPGNILIDGEWALLSDFGLVKMSETGKHLTSTGTSMGTPAYMSPEQVIGKSVDHRTDIYALGVILHKVLTGAIPHDASTPIAVMHRRSIEPVPPLRTIKPDVPESLEHVVLRSLANKPDDRYATAIDFGNALKKAREDPNYREPTIANLDLTNEATMVSHAGIAAPKNGPKNMGLMIGGAAAAAVVLVVAFVLFALFWFVPGDNDVTGPSQTGTETPTNEAQQVAQITPTDTPVPPTATPVPPGTPAALAKIRLEVRSGPGEIYDLVGYLPVGATSEILSQDESGEWWQVKTSLTSSGTGWIKAGAGFTEASDAANVPIALAPPTPTGSPTPEPDTPTPTATPEADTPTATLTPSPSPTSTPTRPAVVVTLPSPTPTEAPQVPVGQLVLLKPISLDDPTFGLTTFEWQYGGTLGQNQGFEVRVWRTGEAPAGVHDAVLDNKQGKIQALGNNTYRLTADIANTPGVLNRRGEYNWTVFLVELEPYKDLGVQAPAAILRFEPPGSGGGGGDGGKGGGGSSGGGSVDF